MRRFLQGAVVALVVFATACAAAAADAPKTATGIVLDAPWKATIYNLARTNFTHPAWGWQHSERNYRVGLELGAGDGLTIDRDVLFAAAFLHDMAAFPPYDKKGVEHGDRAAETSEAVLRDAGFPMAKFAAVQAAERGHMYYSDAGALPEAIVLHDADSLDFLGSIGAARMIALTGAKGPSVAPAIKSLRGFIHDIPPRLITKTARTIGAKRVAELTAILDSLDAESDGGAAL